MLLTNSIIASYASVRRAFSQAVLAVLCMIDVVQMSTAPSQHHCTLQIANCKLCKLHINVVHGTAPTQISCILNVSAAVICSQFEEHCTLQIVDCTFCSALSCKLKIANRRLYILFLHSSVQFVHYCKLKIENCRLHMEHFRLQSVQSGILS